MTNNLTPASAALLVKIINAAEYEGENGMMEALMKFTKDERGNLTDLKKKGFVETSSDSESPDYIWCILQDAARPLYEAIH